MDARSHVDLRPLLAGGLLVSAMLIFPVADGIAKYLTDAQPPVFVSWCRFLASVAIVFLIAICRRRVDLIPRNMVMTQSLRALFLVASMTLYFMAISLVPLADALAAFFVAPVLASLGAIPILGERISRRKLVGVALGFIGTLAIVQPGAGTNIGILLAVASGVIYAGFLITTRVAAQSSPPLTTLLIQFSVGSLVLMPFAWQHIGLLDATTLALALAMGAISVAAHFMAFWAFRLAEASALAPLIYFELLGNVIVGYFAFGDFPQPLTWLGTLLIVAAGIAVIRPGKRASHPRPADRPAPSLGNGQQTR
jgi:drug/metabolite transporter (DMT)-like permease